MHLETIAGAAAMAITGIGFMIGQAEVAAAGSGIIGLITQFGGLGLAVWLAYQHTTVTIPNMQKEHREERIATAAIFKAELDLKRAEYLQSLDVLTKQYTQELHERRTEIIAAIRESACKVKP
jgi:hypothetical protein